MTDARLTQESLEEWMAPNANAQATSVFVEQWMQSGTGSNTRAVATQVALEHWYRVIPPFVGGPMVSIIQ